MNIAETHHKDNYVNKVTLILIQQLHTHERQCLDTVHFQYFDAVFADFVVVVCYFFISVYCFVNLIA